MGTEQIWTIAIGGMGVFISAVCYMMGGTSGFEKYWRRLIGSGVLAADANFMAIMAGNWDWRYILMWPFLTVGMSLGYGGDSDMEKTLKRTLYALGVVSACFIGLWITEFTFFGWIVMILAILTALASVVLGVLNPYSNAPLEQFLISIVLTLYVPWWSFIK